MNHTAPVRVLHVITGLSVAGPQVMLHDLLAGTRGSHESAVVSLGGNGPVGERIDALGVPVHTLGMRKGPGDVSALWRLARLCRRLEPDVVQGWMYHGNLAATLASALSPRRTPVVWGVHISLGNLAAEKRATRALIRLGAPLSAHPKRIVYVSRASADQHEAIGYRPDRRAVIPNGVDCARFRPDAEARTSVRAELGLGQTAPLVGLFARYDPMKDHANFLAAAALLARREPATRFLLAGTGVEWSNKELAAGISGRGLGGRVLLLGERDDMPRLTAALDVASSSSAWGETFRIVLAEAMACGVPCVATYVDGSADVIGETGRVVPPKDPGALAAAWLEVLRTGSRAEFGRRARRRVEENFSLENTVRRYEALWVEVVGAKTGRGG